MPKNKRGQGEWSYTQRKDKLWTARKQFGKKSDGKPNIKAFYGKSITDPCLGWEKTQKLIYEIADIL